MSSTTEIPIGKTTSIREAGFDEYWLQEQICKNPAALTLGDLEVVAIEKVQSSGGRLDILLKDPEDDKMFEVEVMLGETNESHIIRTIEYWDNEKRKFPQRQHRAVLVAESITNRFFNVIQLFSHAIPIIAIQANLVEALGQRFLHFSTVLDTYEEPDDLSVTSPEEHDAAYWRDYSEWTLETANTLLEILKPVFPTAKLHYVKYYIAIEVNGDNCIWIHKRGSGKSSIYMWFSERLLPQASEIMDKAEISYGKKKQNLYFTTDNKTLAHHSQAMIGLAELIKGSWQE